MVLRLLTPWYYLGQDKPEYPKIDPSNGVFFPNFGGFATEASNISWNIGGESNRDVRGNHSLLIRDMAASCATLLKDTKGALPMKTPPRSIAVVGGDASNPSAGPDFQSDEYDVFTGANLGRASYLITPLEAIKTWAYSHKSLVTWNLDSASVIEGLSVNPKRTLDACIVFINSQSGEGSDRTDLEFSYNGTALVKAVTTVCNNTIIITHSVGPNLYSFADNENVTAIIAAHLPSTEAGSSIVDVLSGAVNPSGRLPYTVPYKTSDSTSAPIANFTGSTDPNIWQSNYREGLFIDYRYFDKYNITPRFEFGFGLSYTNFAISDLSVATLAKRITSLPANASMEPGGNPELYKDIATATFTVENTGDVQGATVAQLYLSFPSTAPTGTPQQILRGFSKVYLKASERRKVTINLNRKAMSYWDVEQQDWRIPSGKFELKVGLSSRNIQASEKIGLLT